MSRAISLCLGLCFAWPLAAQDAEAPSEAAAAAELEPALDRTPENCVSTSRLRRTRIIDDGTILFFLRGQDTYQNILPRECQGLKRADRYTYQTQQGRLCSSDTIQLLEDFGGGRLIGTAVCRLGEFYPVTDVEAREMIRISSQRLSRRERRRQAEQAPIEIEAVELPPEQQAEADDARD